MTLPAASPDNGTDPVEAAIEREAGGIQPILDFALAPATQTVRDHLAGRPAELVEDLVSDLNFAAREAARDAIRDWHRPARLQQRRRLELDVRKAVDYQLARRAEEDG